jgi:hypothetical protein
MNEHLHLTHFFHETFQHFSYPKYKSWKTPPSFINKHKVQQEESKMERDEKEKKEKI